MNKSLWLDTEVGKRFEKLGEDKKAEYLIVGGGIAGVTTAYLLAAKGEPTGCVCICMYVCVCGGFIVLMV